MNPATANYSLAADTMAHIRKTRDALAECGIEPRFDVSYEGFGTGILSNVTADGALKFLDRLTETHGAHARYRTRLKSITVSVRIRDKVFPS